MLRCLLAFQAICFFCTVKYKLCYSYQLSCIRPKNAIWQHCEEICIGNVLKAKCKKCGHQLCNKPPRMSSHWSKCSPSDIPSPPTQPSAPQPPAFTGIKRPAEDNTPPPAKRSQPHISSHVFKTDGETANHLNSLVSKFFFGCNIPFSVVEHPLFLDLVNNLRPGYQPPTKKALGDKHLNEVHTNPKTKMKEDLQGKTVTVVEDGWSNIHNEPVVAT